MSIFRAQLTRFRSLAVFVMVISLASGYFGMRPGQGAATQPLSGCIQAPAGLLAWWPLDERSGTNARDIINNTPPTVSLVTIVLITLHLS